MGINCIGFLLNNQQLNEEFCWLFADDEGLLTGEIEFRSFMRPSKFFISAFSSSVLNECCEEKKKLVIKFGIKKEFEF